MDLAVASGSDSLERDKTAAQPAAPIASVTAIGTPEDRSARLASDDYRPFTTTLGISASVSVVLPVKNEAKNLPLVLGSMPAFVTEIVLVDGHSVDDTIAVARQCWPGIKVVAQTGRGKGDALLAGFQAATGEIIVMIDGDGSTDCREIPRFVSALAAGADYAKGSRFANSAGSDDITLGRRFGNWVLSRIVNLVFGTRYTDLCYGYNAFWARHVPALHLECSGFEVETLMNIRAAKAGLRIQEIPSHERCRVHGESNLRVFYDGWRILKVIAAEAGGSPRTLRRRAWMAVPEPVLEPVSLVLQAAAVPVAAAEVSEELA